MINRKTIASILAAATFTGGTLLANPAGAMPLGNSGDPAQTVFNLFDCEPQDATGALDPNGTCVSHNTFKQDASGNFVVGMYWDHGQISTDAPHPTSTVFFDGSGEVPGIGYIQCTSRLAPSGEYSTTCYFNKQTQKNFAPAH